MAFNVGDRVRFKRGVEAGIKYQGVIGTVIGCPRTGRTDERIDVQFEDELIPSIGAGIFELAESEGAPARTGSP
jgi:hypothetical protein